LIETHLLQPIVLLKGIEWHKSDVALKKLKNMLWGLEALQVFDEKLKRGIQEIKDCKKKIDFGLKRVGGIFYLRTTTRNKR
jgi:hypothetical protein